MQLAWLTCSSCFSKEVQRLTCTEAAGGASLGALRGGTWLGGAPAAGPLLGLWRIRSLLRESAVRSGTGLRLSPGKCKTITEPPNAFYDNPPRWPQMGGKPRSLSAVSFWTSGLPCLLLRGPWSQGQWGAGRGAFSVQSSREEAESRGREWGALLRQGSHSLRGQTLAPPAAKKD